MRELSSSWTFFRKVVVPFLWIGFIGFFVADYTDGWKDGVGYSLLFLFGAWAAYIGEFALKRVRIDGDMLHISNFQDRIILPIDEIEKVECYRYGKGRILCLVRLYCRSATPFGSEIDFSPKEAVCFELQEIFQQPISCLYGHPVWRNL